MRKRTLIVLFFCFFLVSTLVIGVIDLDKKDVKLKDKGAEIDIKQGKSNTFNYDNITGIVTATGEISKATIRIPHKVLAPVITAPILYSKEKNKDDFEKTKIICSNYTINNVNKEIVCDKITDPFCVFAIRSNVTTSQTFTNKTDCFYDVKVSKDFYEFDVPHFTDYYINDSGGDYAELQDCLVYNNNTVNTCIINQPINETFNTSYSLKFTSTDAINLVNNATNYTYIDFNKTVIFGDDGSGDRFITYTGGGNDDSSHNSTIYNLTVMDYSVVITQSALSKTSQGFVLKNVNISSMISSGISHLLILSSNITVDNINLKDGEGEGIRFNKAGDSVISNVNVNNVSGEYNIFVSGENCDNIQFDKINASRSTKTGGGGYGLYFDANGCTGGNISNSTFAFNNGTGLHWEGSNSTITGNIFMNNSKVGLEFDMSSTNGTVDVLNNSFENNNNQEPTNSFLASFSRTNVSGTLMNGGNPVVLPSNLDTGDAIFITADDTDISVLADGINNFARWSIDVPVAGLPMGTLYVVMPPAMSCEVVAGAYGGTCYGEQNDYLIANGVASNYTIAPEYVSNQTISVIQGDTDPPYLRYRKQLLKTKGDIDATNGYNLNISNNVFIDDYYYISEDISRIINFGVNNHVTAWNNHFYYSGEVNNSIVEESSFCYKNVGNFYIYNFTKEFGNSECGQSNWTNINQSNSTSFNLIWNNQSSFKTINYTLEYRMSNETAWINYNNTQSTLISNFGNTTINQTYMLKITPNDGIYNATIKEITLNILNHPPTPPITTSIGDVPTTENPTFTWTNSTDVENHNLTYYLELSKKSDFITNFTYQTVLNTLTQASPSTGTYYWRVRATDGSNYSEYSTIYNYVQLGIAGGGSGEGSQFTIPLIKPTCNVTISPTSIFLEDNTTAMINITNQGTKNYTPTIQFIPIEGYENFSTQSIYLTQTGTTFINGSDTYFIKIKEEYQGTGLKGKFNLSLEEDCETSMIPVSINVKQNVFEKMKEWLLKDFYLFIKNWLVLLLFGLLYAVALTKKDYSENGFLDFLTKMVIWSILTIVTVWFVTEYFIQILITQSTIFGLFISLIFVSSIGLILIVLLEKNGLNT